MWAGCCAGGARVDAAIGLRKAWGCGCESRTTAEAGRRAAVAPAGGDFKAPLCLVSKSPAIQRKKESESGKATLRPMQGDSLGVTLMGSKLEGEKGKMVDEMDRVITGVA